MTGTGRLFPKSFEGHAPREFGTGVNIVKTRTFNLAVARDLEAVDVGGSCLWAISSSSLTANIDIYINDQLRDPVTFQQGMFIRGIPFSRLFVSHAAQPAEYITLFFAVEQDTKNIQIVNPSLGFTNVNVQSITQDDSDLYHTLRGEAFIGGWYLTGGAFRNQIELWNPAASGKNLICETMSVYMGAAAGSIYSLRHHNAALANAGAQGNKYLGGAAGVGEVRHESVALLGTEIARWAASLDMKREFTLEKSILIPQGMGLVCLCILDSQDISVVFDWREVDV